MSTPDNRHIDIVIYDNDSSKKHGLPSFAATQQRQAQVELAIVKESLKEILSNFQDILDQQEKPKGTYYIDEIELGLELTAKGTFALVAGAEAGAHASVKLKLKRREGP